MEEGKKRKKFHLDAQSKAIPTPKDPVKAFEGALKGSLDFKRFIVDRQKERMHG